MSPAECGRVERGDDTSLILSMEGRQFRIRREDIKNVMIANQTAAQVWEIPTVAKGQARLSVES